MILANLFHLALVVILTAVVLLGLLALVEWYLHAHMLHGIAGTPPESAHVEHHEVHGRHAYKSAHPDHAYGFHPTIATIIVAGVLVLSLVIGYFVGHPLVIVLTSFGMSLFYVWAFEVVHRRVHQPIQGGWFESTALYRALDRYHHVHHAREDRNFCILVPWFDMLMGTFGSQVSASRERTEA